MSDRSASQRNLVTATIVMVALACGAVFMLLREDGGAQAPAQAALEVQKAVLEGVRQSAQPEALWVQRSEDRMREMQQQITALRDTNEALKAQVAANVKDEARIAEEVGKSVNDVVVKLAEQVQASDARAERAEAEALRLASMVEGLRGDIADAGERGDAAPDNAASERARPASFSEGQGRDEFVTANERARRAATDGGPSGSTAPVGAPFTARPASVEFSLDGNEDRRRKLSEYLPAGSYAPAIVLSGVDASVGVQNASDPRPVLLRVTGPAITAAPGEGDGQIVDITGCTITAEAVGDLSSERVFTRLIAMTCSPEPGVISEMQIAGFVAGQGKAGVRGRVVSREGDAVENAAIAGALSGLAGVVSDIGGTATGDVTSDDQLQGLGTIVGRGLIDAGGQGAGAAFDRLSQYYIDRAEQYQPVVSLYGGTPVEVVFLKGVKIDG